MDDGFFGIVVIALVLALAGVGLGLALVATPDAIVLKHCREKGWHNFGQTRIICSVEKEVVK